MGLPGIVIGVAAAHHAFDLLKQIRVQFEIDTQDFGHRFAGHVVQGRANAAGGDDVAAFHCPLQGLGHTPPIVANRAFVIEIDTDACQLLSEVGAIGIDNLPK